jgi:hypothetical protein
MAFAMDEYVDVAERLQQFYEKYPEGSIQTVAVEDIEIGGKQFIQVWAHAYRTGEDPRPGIGHAREPFPGRTPYTKDSESMNAETSAWGRAIVACGFATKKVASAQEVRNRRAENEAPAAPAAPKTLSAASVAKLEAKLVDVPTDKLGLAFAAIGVEPTTDFSTLTGEQAKALVKAVS